MSADAPFAATALCTIEITTDTNWIPVPVPFWAAQAEVQLQAAATGDRLMVCLGNRSDAYNAAHDQFEAEKTGSHNIELFHPQMAPEDRLTHISVHVPGGSGYINVSFRASRGG